MKKIYLILAIIAVASCNLNKIPDGAINTDDSIESVNDCRRFRNGLYSALKLTTTGAFVYAQDLQTDLLHAVKNFGNFDGDFYTYSVTASNDVAETAWFGGYADISNANHLIEGIEKLLDRGGLSASEESELKGYYGEALYFRAHFYYSMVQYFCEAYDPTTAESNMGVPVVLKYRPTGDSSQYPSRGKLSTVYEQIISDIETAKKYVTLEGSSLAELVNKDVITAFEARLYLGMKDYSTAYAKAKSLIDGGKYSLVSDASDYAEGWIYDNLAETIWQIPIANETEVGNSFSYYIYNTSGLEGRDNPQYIPEDWVLALYDKDNDIRYAAYFDERNVTSPVVGKLTLLVKYPGNPDLYTTVTNYCNMPKVFRISEMYLIAAEAAMENGDAANANLYLNALRAKRIGNWKDATYSLGQIENEIRNERVKELYCEGFRMNDLKRWHIGFSRSEGQVASLVMQGENYAGCTRPADDPMFLWPIPTSELEANPQMKEEQNPGYKLN